MAPRSRAAFALRPIDYINHGSRINTFLLHAAPAHSQEQLLRITASFIF
jgi:hypothetical protein